VIGYLTVAPKHEYQHDPCLVCGALPNEASRVCALLDEDGPDPDEEEENDCLALTIEDGRDLERALNERRVRLVHNFYPGPHADPGRDRELGLNGFRAWLTDEPNPNERRCFCGWLDGREHFGTVGVIDAAAERQGGAHAGIAGRLDALEAELERSNDDTKEAQS
jgi:hypothetical protein